VLVRYRPGHDPTEDWVYNEADVDASHIIWARDMGPEKNEELIEYFKDRKVWLLQPDETPLRLCTYPTDRSDDTAVAAELRTDKPVRRRLPIAGADWSGSCPA
jgi:hypothetical protein